MPGNKSELLTRFDENRSIEEFEERLEDALNASIHYNPRKDTFFTKDESASSLDNTLFVTFLKAIGRYNDLLEQAEVRVSSTGNLPFDIPRMDLNAPEPAVAPDPVPPFVKPPGGLVPKHHKHPPKQPPKKLPKNLVPKVPIGGAIIDAPPRSAVLQRGVQKALGDPLGGRRKVAKKISLPEPEPESEPQSLEDTIAETLDGPEMDDQSRDEAFAGLLKGMVDRYNKQDFNREDVKDLIAQLAKGASTAGLMTDIRTFMSGGKISYARAKVLKAPLRDRVLEEDNEGKKDKVTTQMDKKMLKMLKSKDRQALQAKYKLYMTNNLKGVTQSFANDYPECFRGPWEVDMKADVAPPNLTMLTAPERMLMVLLKFYREHSAVLERPMSKKIRTFLGGWADDPLVMQFDMKEAQFLWGEVSKAYKNSNYDLIADIFYNGLSQNLKFFNVKYNLINVLRVYYTKRKRELDATRSIVARERGSEAKLALIDKELGPVSKKAEDYNHAFETVSKHNWDTYEDESWTEELRNEFFTRPPITKKEIDAINDIVDLDDVEYLAYELEWKSTTQRGIKEGQGISSAREVFERYQNNANKELIRQTGKARKLLRGDLDLPENPSPVDVYRALYDLTH